MPQPPLSDEVAQATLDAWGRNGASHERAAAELGIARSTFQARLQIARERGMRPAVVPPQRYGGMPAPDWQATAPAAEFPEIPDAEPSYEELKSRQISDFTRLHAHKEAAKLIRVNVRIDGPYGVMAMGDPHLDDAGTNWPLLDAHTRLIQRTEGLFGANVGDLSNNWIGRLARLYANQNVSRSRALILIEGWLREVRWLWIDPGNHDLWSGADDPVRWITRFAGIHYKWQGSRLELVPPSGASVVVNSRHDHPDYSQWHPTHGPLKAATMDGYGDDIYTCGHIHAGAYHLHVHPTAKLSHVLRLSSYKVYDQHKDERGFRDANLPAGVFVVNPLAPTNTGRVTFFADPEAGADYLTFLRRPRVRVQAGRAA